MNFVCPYCDGEEGFGFEMPILGLFSDALAILFVFSYFSYIAQASPVLGQFYGGLESHSL